jgi:hypothetical protein
MTAGNLQTALSGGGRRRPGDHNNAIGIRPWSRCLVGRRNECSPMSRHNRTGYSWLISSAATVDGNSGTVRVTQGLKSSRETDR